MEFKLDLVREEKNMLLLRHPYLTLEQSQGHMQEFKREKLAELRKKWFEEKNERFNKKISIADRLNHLKVSEVWD